MCQRRQGGALGGPDYAKKNPQPEPGALGSKVWSGYPAGYNASSRATSSRCAAYAVLTFAWTAAGSC